MQASVRVCDDMIWATHIEKNPMLAREITESSTGTVMWLEVDHVVGSWEKVASYRTGHALRPRGNAKVHWGDLYREQLGKKVAIHRIADPNKRHDLSRGELVTVRPA